MEVKINREIREYKESVFWGLSLRQFIFSLLACAAAVAVYFLFRNRVGTEILSWFCVLASTPFVAFGFIRFNGMNLEDFLNAWLDFAIFIPQKLTTRPSEIINQNAENRRI